MVRPDRDPDFWPTPGPWTYWESTDERRPHYVAAARNDHGVYVSLDEADEGEADGCGFDIVDIATMEFVPASVGGDGLDTMRANARLIAAAPDMLEVLESLCEQHPGTDLAERAMAILIQIYYEGEEGRA